MGTNLLNIFVLCWKDQNASYFPSGKTISINCKHQNEGTFGVNIRGEVFPVPNTVAIPPDTSSPPLDLTDWQQQQALLTEGNTFKPPYPDAIGDANFKICIKVKEMQTGITYYLDAADYATKIVGCNRVPYNNP